MLRELGQVELPVRDGNRLRVTFFKEEGKQTDGEVEFKLIDQYTGEISEFRLDAEQWNRLYRLHVPFLF